MHEYVGAIHMHSVFSDGTGTVEEITGYANEVNLDYIMLTDHNTLRALHEGYERWHGDTLLLVGCEINDRENRNHYLAFGIDEAFSTRLSAKEYVSKVKESGGIGFIAHPHEKRSSMSEHPPFPWLEWDSKGFHGIEIWNHMSEWMEGLTEENKYNRFVHPLRSIESPPKETLEKWDAIAQERSIVGIGGVDAHAHKINLLGFFEVEVFPYKVLFKSIRTHLLTNEKISKNNFKKSKELLYNSLANGHCFISNYYYGDAKGFRFFAEAGGKIYPMGETVPFEKSITLRAFLPDVTGSFRLIKNGELVFTTENVDFEYVVEEKGAYRIEVFFEGKAWIFSNHIRIGI